MEDGRGGIEMDGDNPGVEGKQVVMDTDCKKWWFDTKAATAFAKAQIEGVFIQVFKTKLENYILCTESKCDKSWWLYDEQEITAWALDNELTDVINALGTAINAYEK